MKGKGCPWRWVRRVMVSSMDPAKDARCVHKAMCPIKIRVVDNHHEKDTQDEINGSVLIKVAVNLRFTGRLQLKNNKAYQAIDHQREYRIKYLASNDSGRRIGHLNFEAA